ncbi:hypothetical protein [Desulfoluna sp.]|uniref:hypothetical protein n=1 Tax=Desulfoluna sp. TaxID=2045199 RepID=UPI0026369A1B|nr:hypothetical protein [Desulfoluna sp.]
MSRGGIGLGMVLDRTGDEPLRKPSVQRVPSQHIAVVSWGGLIIWYIRIILTVFDEIIFNHFNPCIYHIGQKMETDKRLCGVEGAVVAKAAIL